MKTIILTLFFGTMAFETYSLNEKGQPENTFYQKGQKKIHTPEGEAEETKQTIHFGTKETNQGKSLVSEFQNADKREQERTQSITSKKHFVSSLKKSSSPEESFFSHVFGNFGKGIRITLIVLASLSILSGLTYLLLLFNSTLLYCSLGIIVLGILTYLIVDRYSETHEGKGSGFLNVLATIGTPVLELFVGLINGLA